MKQTVLGYGSQFLSDYRPQIDMLTNYYDQLKPLYRWRDLIPGEFYNNCEGVDYNDVGFENCVDEEYFKAAFDWNSVGDAEIDKILSSLEDAFDTKLTNLELKATT